MTVSIANLPDRLPDTGAIDAAGGRIGNAGAMAKSHAADGVRSWSGLSAHYSSPDAATALNAVNMVQVFADEASTCAVAVELALRDFVDAIDGLKAEYETVKELAATHNAVDTTVEDFDMSAHHSAAAELQRRIDAVATTYDDASKACADAIRKANTGKLFEVDSGGTPVWIATYLTKKTVEGYHTKGGTAYFKYEFANPRIVRPTVLDRLPVPPLFVRRVDQWVEAGNNWIDDTHRALLPQVTKNEFVRRVSGYDGDNKMLAALLASPKFRNLLGTDGKTKNPNLHRLLQRHNLTVGKDGKISVGYAAADGKTKGMPKVPKWAENTVKGINVGSNVLGGVDKTSKQYEELRTQHPDWSQEQLMIEAVADGATEQLAEMAGEEIGGKIGQVAGRAGGAALGTLLIPIPGVGAAVGGVVGGFVGEMAGSWIGGKIGGAAGGWIADNTNATELVKDVGNVVSSGVDKAKDFIGGLFG